MKKRMRSVESGRRRGGQPGNRNALTVGLYTAAHKERRRKLRLLLQETYALIAFMNHEVDKARGRA